jgi:hypothetical protein
MKKINFITVIILFTVIFAGSMASAKTLSVSPKATSTTDRMYINPFNIKANESEAVDVILKNSMEYTAFQCDIYLPDSLLQIAKNAKGKYMIALTDRKSDTHVVSSALQEDGAVRVVVYSSDNDVFTGTDGAILSITFKADSTIMNGTYTANIKNIRLSDVNANEFLASDNTFVITVTDGRTSIGGIHSSAMKVYAEGRTLHIDSPDATSVQMVSSDGIVSYLSVSAGSNTFNIENAGLYIINHQKVVIR